MSNRGDEEQQKGPIRRYGRRGKSRRPSRKSDHAHSDASAAESTPSPTFTTTSASTTDPTSTPPSSPGITGFPNFPPPSSIQWQTVSESRRSGSGLRWAIIAGTTLIIIAAVAIPVISVSNTIHNVNGLFSHSGNTPAPTTPTGTPAPPSGTKPAKPVSYLTTPGLRAGLARIAHMAPGARVALVRIAEGTLSATVKLPNGNIKELIFAPTGTFTVSVPTLGERAIPLSQISPRAVARLIAGMRARFHVPVSRIDYIVLSTPPGVPTQWVVFSKAPGHPGYTARLNGSGLARLPS